MPMCVLFLIWPRDPLSYQTSLLFSIILTFEADLRGLFMLWICLKTLFWSQYTFRPPPTTVHWASINWTIWTKNVQDTIFTFHNKIQSSHFIIDIRISLRTMILVNFSRFFKEILNIGVNNWPIIASKVTLLIIFD